MIMEEFRKMAAAIDLRMQQLAAEGVQGLAMIEPMIGHLPDLQRIWTGASDEQLAALCKEFFGFHRYATLMEEAAEAERAKPSRIYDDFPLLSDPFKQSLSALLADAATLERDYQAVLNAGNSPGLRQHVNELTKLYCKWVVNLEMFTTALNASGVPKKAVDFITDTFGRMAERIAQLEDRAMTG
jgi:hypothetical protein